MHFPLRSYAIFFCLSILLYLTRHDINESFYISFLCFSLIVCLFQKILFCLSDFLFLFVVFYLFGTWSHEVQTDLTWNMQFRLSLKSCFSYLLQIHQSTRVLGFLAGVIICSSDSVKSYSFFVLLKIRDILYHHEFYRQFHPW